MCKKNFDRSSSVYWTILKYSIFTLIDLILSISGLIYVSTVYALYNSTLIFYFIIYNIIISLFNIFHFVKVFKDMLEEKLNDVTYVKIKVLLMITSFIWGIIILEHSEIILFYQQNYPKVYTNFINYFIVSSLSILDVIYKIINYLYLKNKKKQINSDYEFLLKINEDMMDEIGVEMSEITYTIPDNYTSDSKTAFYL